MHGAADRPSLRAMLPIAAMGRRARLMFRRFRDHASMHYKISRERVAANGPPLGRGAVSRDKRFSASTRVAVRGQDPEAADFVLVAVSDSPNHAAAIV